MITGVIKVITLAFAIMKCTIVTTTEGGKELLTKPKEVITKDIGMVKSGINKTWGFVKSLGGKPNDGWQAEDE